MSDRAQYIQDLQKALNEKARYFDTERLPKALENIKLLHTCVRNLYDLLLKRSLITPDPYRESMNITKISAPPSDTYPDGEIGVVIGARLSFYEAMLEFISTRFKFTCDNFSLQKIKRFNELLDTFSWGNMSTMSEAVNTRGLASLIHDSRKNLDGLSGSLLNDSIAKAGTAMADFQAALRELTNYKREEYKYTIRTEICGGVDFDYDKVANGNDEVAAIKKAITALPKKMPTYSELLTEIANEDFGASADSLKERVLKSLAVKAPKKKIVKDVVDTKAMIIDAMRALTIIGPIYATIADKLITNRDVLEDSKMTLFEKIKQSLRRSFKMKESPVIYRFVIEDKERGAKRTKDVDINVFISNIMKKSALLNALNNPQSAEFKKVAASNEELILNFTNKQITENKEILTLLIAADEFFKNNVKKSSRTKIKGLKIDLVTVNNGIIKANKRRADYTDAAEATATKKPAKPKTPGGAAPNAGANPNTGATPVATGATPATSAKGAK